MVSCWLSGENATAAYGLFGFGRFLLAGFERGFGLFLRGLGRLGGLLRDGHRFSGFGGGLLRGVEVACRRLGSSLRVFEVALGLLKRFGGCLSTFFSTSLTF